MATQLLAISQVKAITYKSIVLFSYAAAALVTFQVFVTLLSVVALTRSLLKIAGLSVRNMVLSALSKFSLQFKIRKPLLCGGFFYWLEHL